MKLTKNTLVIAFLTFSISIMTAQKIPAAYGQTTLETVGILRGQDSKGQMLKLQRNAPKFTLSSVTPTAKAALGGLQLHFSAEKLKKGTVTYGLIPYGLHTFPTAVLRFNATVDTSGNAFLNITKDLSEGYDCTGWLKAGHGIIGYRLTDPTGLMVYEGKLAFAAKEDSILPRPTILRGPFVSCVSQNRTVIWYDTSEPDFSCIKLENAVREYASTGRLMHHECTVKGLTPDSTYRYTVCCGNDSLTFTFRTALDLGSQKPFSFAYASDSRSGYGGGERNVYGANMQIMSRIGALACAQNARFVQFTGDLANGYVSDPDEMTLQQTNWIHAVEPFWHYLPFHVGMGNHESLGWASTETGNIVADGFPYDTHSAEAVFAKNFVNFDNGPHSEDGTKYDPDPYKRGDFPSYRENVYSYVHGNTAMIVLNSDYWYAPSLKNTRPVGGNLHGYIMDEQLRWLKNTLAEMESDAKIDHIFVTVHTPPFPNGGHRGDCMWYDGNNEHRPYINNQPVEKGIIERRDDILDLCANRSTKVIGFLSGDEHNYNRMEIEESTPRYPLNWDKPRLKLNRPLWQIINGAAGAPFYAQQVLPWSAAVKGFTVQNALCFFDIEGKKIRLRVINPDTLELLDSVQLR